MSFFTNLKTFSFVNGARKNKVVSVHDIEASVLADLNTISAPSIQSYSPLAGGTVTIDLFSGNVHHIVMPGGNITVALKNQRAGQCFIVRILQDSSGSRLVAWFSTIKWAGGGAPTLTTTANKADTLGFEVTGTSTYDGYVVGQNI